MRHLLEIIGGLYLISMLLACSEGGPEAPLPDSTGGTAAAGGTAGIGGTGGSGGSGGSGAAGGWVRCKKPGCECTRDCCSTTDLVESVIRDPESGEWFCPPGTVEWEGCDPSLCPCDLEEKDFACWHMCCGPDVFMGEPVCRNGEWVCGGMFPEPEAKCLELWENDLCPCETAKRHYRGDRCDQHNQVYCELSDDVFEACDTVACQTCVGATLPVEKHGCSCWCDEEVGFVQCARQDG
jgi:hypothetical protein